MEVRGNVKVVFSDGTFELQERRLRINVKFESIGFPEQIHVQVFNLHFVGGAGNALCGSGRNAHLYGHVFYRRIRGCFIVYAACKPNRK